MRVILAPDSFKGSLGAVEAAEAMARGVRRAAPGAAVDRVPVGDGGEGTLDALVAANGGRVIRRTVTGPLGAPVEARWGRFESGGERVAIIEMAEAAGLGRVPPAARDPERTTTAGVGALLEAAREAGARVVLVGLGGSATVDGGCGMAGALGVRFLDERGAVMAGPMTGGCLGSLGAIEAGRVAGRWAGVSVVGLSDVRSPLLGPRGAAAVYGPQKGATPAQVVRLEAGLGRLAALWRRDLGRAVSDVPGAGAAGGLGGGLAAFLGARLEPGIDRVLEATAFRSRVRGADLCLTGEGRLDAQTLEGKACLGVARAAWEAGVPTVALVGSAGPGAERVLGAELDEYRVIGPELEPAESIRRAAELLERAAEAVIKNRR